ncbi:MAG: glycosyltransferase [Acetobacteraceae bacterium]|nr:glycosyltransferase [Acetobacteraceae bacterium]
MRLLVWQWGRRGAGPRYAAWLGEALRRVAPEGAALSLSAQSELLRGDDPPRCELPVDTYESAAGFAAQWLRAPLHVPQLARAVAALRPDVALCAMPGPLDLLMAAALGRARVPFAVVVHDADAHPGDGLPLQMPLQRRLLRRADAVVALSGHVAERLRASRNGVGKIILRSHLPPFRYGDAAPPRAHGGRMRLLCFGRLLPYKGLDLLVEALQRLGPCDGYAMRVVGQGPESAALQALRALPGVKVENRWVPETEIADLLAWADAVVLPYREASQSGAAATAVAARRYVVATDVGGLREQLGAEPLARLCAPTAEGLAAALLALIASPPHVEASAFDVTAAWDAVAVALCRDLAALQG